MDRICKEITLLTVTQTPPEGMKNLYSEIFI